MADRWNYSEPPRWSNRNIEMDGWDIKEAFLQALKELIGLSRKRIRTNESNLVWASSRVKHKPDFL